MFSRDAKGRPTAEAKFFTRSISRHLAAFTAVWNSSVNSYRRLWDEDFRGVATVSDHGRRDGLIRIVESKYGGDRIELRTPDALTNPYLAIALCLQSMATTAAGKDWGRPAERAPSSAGSGRPPSRLSARTTLSPRLSERS